MQKSKCRRSFALGFAKWDRHLVPDFTLRILEGSSSFLHFEEATLSRRVVARLFSGMKSVPGFTLLHFSSKVQKSVPAPFLAKRDTRGLPPRVSKSEIPISKSKTDSRFGIWISVIRYCLVLRNSDLSRPRRLRPYKNTQHRFKSLYLPARGVSRPPVSREARYTGPGTECSSTEPEASCWTECVIRLTDERNRCRFPAFYLLHPCRPTWLYVGQQVGLHQPAFSQGVL